MKSEIEILSDVTAQSETVLKLSNKLQCITPEQAITAMNRHTKNELRYYNYIIAFISIVLIISMLFNKSVIEENRILRTDTLYKSIQVDKGIILLDSLHNELIKVKSWRNYYNSHSDKEVNEKIKRDKIERLQNE